MKKLFMSAILAFLILHSNNNYSQTANDTIPTQDLDEVVVSDTIPFLTEVKEDINQNSKVVRLTLAPLLAESIRRVIYMRSTAVLTASNVGE